MVDRWTHGSPNKRRLHDNLEPWFEDMSQAQTPAQAASWPVELVLAPTFDPAYYGELVQFAKVIPWMTGIPLGHTTTA
jgi:carbonyl reductase 1